MTDLIDHAVWTYDREARTVTVGSTGCHCTTSRCGEFAGRQFAFPWVACAKCKGTGKRGNGKCRACAYHRPSEYGPKRERPGYFIGAVPDYANPYDAGPCTVCDGSLLMAGDGNARMPADVLAAFHADTPFELTATTARHSWAEEHVGFRSIDSDEVRAKAYSVHSDYGRRWNVLVAAKAAGTLDAALDELRAECESWFRKPDISRSVCNWALDETAPRSGTWLLPTRFVAMVSPSGVRYMAVRDKNAN